MDNSEISEDEDIDLKICKQDSAGDMPFSVPPRPPMSPLGPSKKAKNGNSSGMGDFCVPDNQNQYIQNDLEELSAETENDSGFIEKSTSMICDEPHGTIDCTDNAVTDNVETDNSQLNTSTYPGPITSELANFPIPNSIETEDKSQSKKPDYNITEDASCSTVKFIKSRSSSKTRNYRNSKSELHLSDSSNDGESSPQTATKDINNISPERSNEVTEREEGPRISAMFDVSDYDSDVPENRDNHDSDEHRYSSSDTNHANADSDSDDEPEKQEKKDAPIPVLLKPKPKHAWSVVPELTNRQIGMLGKSRNRHSWAPQLFQQRFYGSLHAVQRLELMYKLDEHDGCVNSLCFNQQGNLLASGSDDLSIVLWSWTVGRKLCFFESGHRTNVFQSKFLGLKGDLHIASSARDGQIRLAELGPDGDLKSSRKLAQHKGMVHKISAVPAHPYQILSAGEDGLVIKVDVREPNPEKILVVKDETTRRTIPLYSINCHPLSDYEFCVAGRDPYVRVYDPRNVSEPVTKLKPLSETGIDFKANKFGLHITAAVYNYDGSEILASYSDDDIYLFDNSLSTVEKDKKDFIGRYSGHRNSATIKGVSFFGPKSEYIVSGSDCGNCYFWDKKTESIVQWFQGDENGVVNCLEPHPSLPVIATSGLDYDVKIWVPSKEAAPELTGLAETVKSNTIERDCTMRGSDLFDGQMLWMFWNHMRRTEHRQRRANQANINSDVPEMSSSSDSDSDTEGPRDSDGFACNPS